MEKQIYNDRIQMFRNEPELVKEYWENTFQFNMAALELPFTDIRKLPIIHFFKKFKAVKYGFIRAIFYNIIEDYLMQIKVFNEYEEFELSGKIKYLAERTMVEYIKALFFYDWKILFIDENTDQINVDFLSMYYCLSQKILFDKKINKSNIPLQEVTVQLNDIVIELDNWYQDNYPECSLEPNKEVIQCSE